jgi:hypothetical protein
MLLHHLGTTCRGKDSSCFVIARSVSDEAIQTFFCTLDCFASLAMTERNPGVMPRAAGR